MARWQSGDAAACKAVNSGSIPLRASKCRMNSSSKKQIEKNLVLIGGGHSHLNVLKSFAMNKIDGLRITLISDVYETPYSGMLPGYIENDYSLDDIQIDLNPADIRIDTYRASGAGGQHVNKTDSAVRLTHIPSGVVVQCQTQRSQHKNKDSAMKQLRAKLFEIELKKQQQEMENLEASKADIGWGSQIRSYVLDSARIKDLRTGVETGNCNDVLDGNLDLFIEASLKQGIE